MKTIVGWLGDPYLHIFGIGLIILAVGAGLGSDPGRGESCDLCHKVHEMNVACPKVPATLTR